MKISASIVFGRKVSGAFLCDASLCRWCKVRRSSDQPGNVLGGGIQYHAGRLSGRQAFRVGLELGQIPVPAVGKSPVLHAKKFFGLFGILFAVCVNACEPDVAQLFAALPDSSPEVLIDSLGDVKLLVLGPSIIAFRQSHLFFSQSLAA